MSNRYAGRGTRGECGHIKVRIFIFMFSGDPGRTIRHSSKPRSKLANLVELGRVIERFC